MSIPHESAEVFRKHAGREGDPMAVKDAVALVENPRLWLIEATGLPQLFKAWLTLLDEVHALEFAARLLGQERYQRPFASVAMRDKIADLMQRPEPSEDPAGNPFPGLVHRDDFEAVLAMRMHDALAGNEDGGTRFLTMNEGEPERFMPFAPVTRNMFVMRGGTLPEGVEALAGRVEALKVLQERARAYQTYLVGAIPPFTWTPREGHAEALTMLGEIGTARGEAERALEDAKREAGELAIQNAQRKAAKAREEREAAEEEARRAAQRRIDAQRAEEEADMEAARLAAMAGMGR